MKKRMTILALIVSLLLAAGCGSVDRETQESYRKLGLRKLSEQDYKGAADSFQKALDESRGKIGDVELDICYYKALSLFKSGDFKGAIETYDSLLAYDDENAEVYFLRGSVYLQNKELEKGIRDYDNAVELDPDNYVMYAEIYENLCALDGEEQGKGYLKLALAQKPSSGEEYCGQGYLYLLLEDYDQADKMFAQAVDKGYEKAMLYQAQVLKARGEDDRAHELFEAYSSKYPKDADALNEIGVLEMNAGDYKEALKNFEKAASLDSEGENQSLRLNLIYAYEYNGEFQKAYDLMKVYLKDHPKDADAQREFTFLKSRVLSRQKNEKEDAAADSENGAVSGEAQADEGTAAGNEQSAGNE